MPKLECAVAESLLKPFDAAPVLSIVVPTHQRPAELGLTVSSLADQLTGGLERKAEVIVSDNGSGPDTLEAIRVLAARYPNVSYVFNARDEGGFFNFFAAPWRARGAYTWVFGSDDLLLNGGVASVIGVLERDAPSFLTLNKQLVNAGLSEVIWESANSVPSRRFDTFIDLFCALGVNQLAFISGQIEHTETARKLDAEPYLRTDSRHPHLAAYLEKHAHAPASYSAERHLVHRAENSQVLDYHSGNFFDYAATLPRLLLTAMAKVGAPRDLFERISGHKRAASYDPPDVTFVDNLFENALRAMYSGRYLTVGHRRTLEDALAHCRSDRLAQFAEIWTYSQSLELLERREGEAKAALQNARQQAVNASAMFTRFSGSTA